MKRLTTLLFLLLFTLPVMALQFDGYVNSGLYHASGTADRLEPAASDADAASQLRSFDSASLRMRFSPRLQFKTRVRYAMGFQENDSLSRFDLLQAALRWRSMEGALKIEAGRISPFQLALPLKVDGVDLQWQMNASSGIRVTSGYRVPLPGDFSYDTEDLVANLRYNGRFTSHRYSLMMLWDGAENGGVSVGGELKPPPLFGVRARTLYLFSVEDMRTEDWQVYLSRRFSRNLLLTGRYRLAASHSVTVGNMEILPRMYDSMRLAMMYRQQDWRFHLSQLATITADQEWYHTRFTVGWRWIDLGAVKTFGADRDRWQATAALAVEPGYGLRVTGGFNLLEYESATNFASDDEDTGREQGMLYGSNLGVAWNWRNLHLKWQMYHLSNFLDAEKHNAWDGQLRNVVSLRYNFGGQL
jgi:hypothetical protein